MEKLKAKQGQKGFLHSRAADLLVGGLLGLFVFLLIYGFIPLDFTRDDWLLNGYQERDLVAHYAGWMGYRESPWSWPLGYFDGLQYPDGIIVSYTDSIPLAAIFFKALSPLLPQTFQYFGFYNMLCFVLQGVTAAALLRLFIDNRIYLYLGTVLFCLSPILIERAFRHTALASHWLILSALYFYFVSQRNKNAIPKSFIVLPILAIGIHPYFLPAVFGILCAILFNHIVNNKKFLRPMLYLLVCLAATVGMGFALGVFGSGAVIESEGGYGYFCMNLNALFNPISRQDVVWSSILPVLPQTLGNYDGFNYLGVGVMIALLTGLALFLVNMRFSPKAIWQRVKEAIGPHKGLLIACIAFTLFALSNVWTFNGHTVFGLILPNTLNRLFSIFRSSGRIFYPVNYLLLLVAVIGLWRGTKRYKKQWISLAAIIMILAVQLVDLSPALKQKHTDFTDESIRAVYSENIVFSSPEWQQLATDYDFEAVMVLGDANDYTMSAYAAKYGLRSYTVVVEYKDLSANAAQRETAIDMLAAGQLLQRDILYVFARDPLLEAALSRVMHPQMALYDMGPYCGIFYRNAGVPFSELTAAQSAPAKLAQYSDDIAWVVGVDLADSRLAFPINKTNEIALSHATAVTIYGQRAEVLGVDLTGENFYILQLAPGVDLMPLVESGEVELRFDTPAPSEPDIDQQTS